MVKVGFSGQNRVQEYVTLACVTGGMHSKLIYTAAGKTGPGGSVRSTTGIAGEEEDGNIQLFGVLCNYSF